MLRTKMSGTSDILWAPSAPEQQEEGDEQASKKNTGDQIGARPTLPDLISSTQLNREYKMKKFLVLSAAAVLAGQILASATPAFAAEEKYITIGTGGQTGVYFVVGQSICKLVNRNTSKHGIKCTAPSTGGSIANINAIKAGNQDMGVAQSDWQYHAYNGTAKFEEDGAFKDLRAVFSVHGEPFTVVARKDSGATKFSDLKGKRVNVGNPGSGQRATMGVVLDALGLFVLFAC